MSPRAMEIKTKINKWDLIKLKPFAQQRKPQTKQKDNPQNGRKYSQTMQLTGISLQNLQTAHVAQCPKNKQPNQIMGRRLK